jgi:hypothetical protein
MDVESSMRLKLSVSWNRRALTRRFSPVSTWAESPTRSQARGCAAAARRTSAIDPLLSTRCRPGASLPSAKRAVSANSEVNVRSSSVDALNPTITRRRTGPPTAMIGKRATVLFWRTPPTRSERNSGSYWNAANVRAKSSSDVGLTTLTGSNSPSAPPVPWARVLNWPAG